MKNQLIIAAALLLTFTACSNTSEDSKAKQSSTVLPPPVAETNKEVAEYDAVEEKASGSLETASAVQNVVLGNVNMNLSVSQRMVDTARKIIKEGDIRFETNNVAETRKQITASLKKLDGYADEDSENTSGYEGSKEYTLNIRIPAKNFDAFVGTVASTAVKIDSRNIRIKDVTSQFIDVKTRLDNKKQLEVRYLDLLKRATKMSDLLEIEGKLTEIRSDIESTQSQLNYMSKQVAYSSLSITFYTKQANQVAAGNGFGYKFKAALTGGWSFLQGLFFGVVSLWPLWLTISIIWLLIKRWAKRNNNVDTAGN